MPGTRSKQRLCQRHLAGLNPYLYIFFLTIPSRTFLFLLLPPHLLLSFYAALVSPRLSPSCLYPFPNISRASVASCDWCACDYSSWQPHSSMRRNPKIPWKKPTACWGAWGQRGALQESGNALRTNQTVTVTPSFDSLWTGLRRLEANIWISSFFPPSSPVTLAPSLPYLLLLLLLISSSFSFFFFDFFCLASGPLELYLISFCWVN